MKPGETWDVALDTNPKPSLLRRFFPFYCALAALATLGYALYDSYQIDGDAVAYMDIADNLRAQHWAGIVNGYWHPMYPAFLALGHALFRASLATELRAYYFVNFAIFLLGMVAVICFTDALARLRATASWRVDSRISESRYGAPSYLLDRTMLRYLGVALLVIASQREFRWARFARTRCCRHSFCWRWQLCCGIWRLACCAMPRGWDLRWDAHT